MCMDSSRLRYNSPTFKSPPLDGTLSVPEFYDFLAVHAPNHPVFNYVNADGRLETVFWPQLTRAIHRAGRLTIRSVGSPSTAPNTPVVAILAAADTFTYFTLLAGILRAGYQAFPISVRNSALGVRHLLKATGARHVFVSKDPPTQRLIHSVTDEVSDGCADQSLDLSLFPMPSYEALFANTEAFEQLPPMKKLDHDSPALVLHSSGTSSFPKPIPLTHRILLQWALSPYYGEIDFSIQTLACHSLPMFHAMGAIQICWTASTGLTISAFSPHDTPGPPSPDRVLEGAAETGSTLIFCVPTFVEHWSLHAKNIEVLKKFVSVIFAGGPLSKDVSDLLITQEVPLVPFYGLTEAGAVTMVFPRGPEKEGSDYFRISPHCDPVFLPQDDRSDVFELVLLECPAHTPSVFNYTAEGRRGYATNDLIMRHPTNPSLWRVLGRVDDQIMHSTGEKTNPGPIESILLKDPLISQVVMFGRGRFYAGILVSPVPEQAFEPSHVERLESFRDEIWKSVETANAFAPSHSRIFKEMILVADPAKPFELTPKGTPRRQAVLAAYANEIEVLYASVEQSTQKDLDPPLIWTLESATEFVRLALKKTLSVPVGDEDDIFQQGCDSLQATWIRSALLHGLRRSLKTKPPNLPYDFVYAHPSIRLLGKRLLDIATESGEVLDSGSSTSAVMKEMVAKYVQDFPVHSGRDSAVHSNGEVALLTGGTGGFGSYILKSLLENPSFCRVYCLNRPDPKGTRTCYERQRDALVKWGIDPQLADSAKLVHLEGDLSIRDLALDPALLQDVRENVTCIVHNAWKVDFNVTLPSMEHLIQGTRVLIDLALSSSRPSPPTILFTSSISVFTNWDMSCIAPEAALADPEIAKGSGYSESKWVAETLLYSATKETRLRSTIVRIGQLCGGPDGFWNPNDWFPSLVRSGKYLKCLPQISGSVSWIPTHIAADALIEMRHSTSQFATLAHPHPIPWSMVIHHTSRLLNLPVVPYSKWLSLLEDAEEFGSARVGNPSSEVDIPALRLLQFFRDAQNHVLESDASGEAFGLPTFSTADAVAAAPAAFERGGLSPLDEDDVARWVKFWGLL
ncbi:hypothetical protein JAAARDRAFT_184391 [Jaapia argillacea MUCL 33604]|uniref:Polyketide synthase phosphopantetheine-binding domain-containing protein n=1 Tax=Jaapia argillacea MUCL 33604 TaxID=933084 RepID=A0A067PBD7_9AGAM|nr:hypothetical protein JAAARDRAFT_184391 [Jaapia argillacea MUCL 33604]